MSFSSKLRKFVPKSLKGIVVGAVIAAAAVAGLSAYRAYAADSYNCDNNAVVYCGASSASQLASKYNSGDGHNKAYTIQDIYHWFGIGSGDVNDMKSDSVEGSVTSSGDVYAGSTLVATNALTGGREYISGSTTEKYGATTFYTRKPSVSFLQGSLTAMVVMKNGVFQFAILHACGNPVIGTPKKPSVSIIKKVRAAGTSSYGSNVTVKSGSEVQYQITASSTGQVPADNMTVSDALPSDITYTSGSLDVNGKAANASAFFSKGGLNLGDVKNGTNEVITFNATAGKVSATDPSCQAENMNNYGYVWALGLGVQNSHAGVTTTCTPPPPQVSLACDQLTLTPGTIDQNTGDQTYTLAAAASVKNATITGYTFTFGDSATSTVTTSATTAQTTHSYAPGSYTASVEVTATANGQTIKETSANCEKSITVTPPAPSTLTCDQLSLTPGNVDSTTGNTAYTLAASATAQNATINSYVFTLGDGSANQTVTTGNTSASTTHTYAPGTYNVTVSVNGTEKGKTVTETSANCAGQITVKPPVTPPTPTYSCDGLTATPGDVDSTTGATSYTLAATASVSNATITNYVFNFDDNNQTQTVTTGNTSASTTHTYAPGTYNPTVTVTVTLSDGTTKQVTSAACATKITVNAPTCTAPNGQTYPVGSSECTPQQTCTAPNGQTYPQGSANCTTCQYNNELSANSPQCTPPPTCTSPTNGQKYPMGSAQCQTPTQLPNTGAGNMIGLFAGVSAAAAVLHWLFVNRRLGRNSL